MHKGRTKDLIIIGTSIVVGLSVTLGMFAYLSYSSDIPFGDLDVKAGIILSGVGVACATMIAGYGFSKLHSSYTDYLRNQSDNIQIIHE